MQKLVIKNFLGLAPGYDDQTFIAVGNPEYARDMTAVNLFQRYGLAQGEGISSLTNNNVVTTLIDYILDYPAAANLYFAAGGSKLYKVSSATVTNDGTWPWTIAAHAGQSVRGLAYYHSKLYYAYHYTGGGGDIGQNDTGTVFDDDYMSTIPTGAATLPGGDVLYPMIVGGNDVLYIGAGSAICSFNGTTFTTAALTNGLPTDMVVVSLAWFANRLWIAANRVNTSTNKNYGAIFVWDTVSSTWDYEIPVGEKIGALYLHGGRLYCFWQQIYTSGFIQKLSVINGTNLLDLFSSSGRLPTYPQITTYRGHLLWYGYNDGILAYGTSDEHFPPRLFKSHIGKYNTHGGLSAALGGLIIPSSDGANYDIASTSGYTTGTRYKSMNIQLADGMHKANIARVVVFTAPLATGAKVDTVLRYDSEQSNSSLTQIAYDSTNAKKTKHTIFDGALTVENFSLEFSWANGSTSNPVAIKEVHIFWEPIDDL